MAETKKIITEEEVRRMINEMISNFDYKSFIKRGFIEVMNKATGQKVRLNGAKNRLEFITGDQVSTYIQDDGIPGSGFLGTTFTILDERAGISIGSQEIANEATLFNNYGSGFLSLNTDSMGVSSVATNNDIIITHSYDAWTTSTAYVDGDFVMNSGESYVCTIDHTSGTFATDLAAGKWLKLAENGLVLRSPDGTQFRLKVANDGTLSTEEY